MDILKSVNKFQQLKSNPNNWKFPCKGTTTDYQELYNTEIRLMCLCFRLNRLRIVVSEELQCREHFFTGITSEEQLLLSN